MTFRAHVEARFESAHRNGPPGHKCAGQYKGVTPDIRHVLETAEKAGLIAPGGTTALSGQFSVMLDFHGHSWLGVIEWTYDESKLDAYGWGPDFGAVKDLIRKYDHHNLNLVHPQPSAENLAKAIYEEFMEVFGFEPDFVRLHEGHGNTMEYTA